MPDEDPHRDEVDELVPMIRARLHSLLALVQVEVDGQPVEVTGFRRREGKPDVEAQPVHRRPDAGGAGPA
jgi:hypothetical protein